MKILYIHQYFKTPEEGGAIRSYYLAKGLVEYGYHVDLITSHNKKDYSIKEIEGIRVHYLPVFYRNDLGFLGRVFSFLKFALLAFKTAKNIKEINICYATSTPLTVGLTALALKYIVKIPFIFEVRDLWPEAPIQIGAVKNAMVKNILKYLENILYKQSEQIVSLSPAMRDYIKVIVPEKKVTVIPNMADLEFFNDHKENLKLKGDDNKFRIIYFGAIGKVNHLQYLLNIAEECQENENLEFMIVGEGAELNTLKSISSQKKMKNLSFLPHLNKFQLKDHLAKSDAVYISFKNIKILQTSSPNKFFDGLAAGKLIILNFQGWLKDLVELHQCGIFVDPNEPKKFIKKIEPFISDKQLLLEFQSNSFKLAKSFSKETQIKKLISIIEGEMGH